MRTVTHPGAPLQPRRLHRWAEPGPVLRVVVPVGADLLTTLHATLRAEGVHSAAVVLLGGTVQRLSFYTGRPLEAGERVATFNGPHEIACPAVLLGANATFGIAADGAPQTHCHALFVDRDGAVRGGHLQEGGTIAGPGGIAMLATGLRGAGFRVSHDSETNFPIFHPAEVP